MGHREYSLYLLEEEICLLWNYESGKGFSKTMFSFFFFFFDKFVIKELANAEADEMLILLSAKGCVFFLLGSNYKSKVIHFTTHTR